MNVYFAGVKLVIEAADPYTIYGNTCLHLDHFGQLYKPLFGSLGTLIAGFVIILRLEVYVFPIFRQ